MSDTVTSICVLNRSKEGEILILALTDGTVTHIAVHEAGGDPKSRDPEWTYEEKDGKLHLSPSLLCEGHNFHTAANWIVVFERHDGDNPWDKFYRLNPHLI